MKSKKLIYILGLILSGAIAFFSQQGKSSTPEVSTPTPTQQPHKAPSKTQKTTRLQYQGKNISITRHAECRMDCRHIDAQEVAEVIAQRRINTRKSDPQGRPCPTIALEGKTHDGQEVRVILAECTEKVKLVTVIDLENKYQCNCK